MSDPKKPFALTDALVFAFDLLKREWRFYLILLVVFGAVIYWPTLVLSFFRDKEAIASLKLVLVAISIPIQIIAGMGLIKICLRAYDTHKKNVEDLFSQYTLFFNYVLASIIFSLIVIGGLILFVVPGIYLAVRLQFYNYLIIDDKIGPVEALKKSFALTHGMFWPLFWFDLVLVLISIILAAILFVGPLAGALFGTLATVYVYRKLQKR